MINKRPSFKTACLLIAVTVLFSGTGLKNNPAHKETTPAAKQRYVKSVSIKKAENKAGRHKKGQPVPQGKNKQDNIVHILFLGMDRTKEREKTIGIFRTDTIAVASVNMQTKKANVLSIPRDTYTFVPVEQKKDKINHAYAYGSLKGKGIKSTVEAVNLFLKYTKIDYYFALDMEPVPEIIDSIGGVELEVEVEMKGYGVNLNKGRQILNGSQVYDYIRWRRSGAGDIDRIKRQQKLVLTVMEKLKRECRLLDAVKVVMGYGKNVQTNLTIIQLTGFAWFFANVSDKDSHFYVVPGRNQVIEKLDYWVPEEKMTENVLKICLNP